MAKKDPNDKIVQQLIEKLGPPDGEATMRAALKSASRDIEEAERMFRRNPDEQDVLLK